jgi:hypothetical protein
MREIIKAGTVLFKEGTLLPNGLTFDSEPFSPGWRSIKSLDGYAIGRKIPDVGWAFFYMAGENRTTAIGREGQKTVLRATKKILAGLKSEKSNSIEITNVVFKTFLGMPYARVSFHLRNLQQGVFLSGSGDPRAWKDAAFVAA